MTEPDDPRDRFAAIRAELEQMDLPDPDRNGPKTDLGTGEDEDPIEARLREMDEKVRDAGDTRLPPVPEVRTIERPNTDRETSLNRSAARGLGNGLAAAYSFIGATLVGIGLGYLLDAQLKTEIFKAIGAIGGAGLGLFLLIKLQAREG